MATVSALGTNYNLPNYHGRVHYLTPSDTPFTTALMGTSGLEVETARTFEWTTADLRAAAQNTVVDGDSAGTPENRDRSNVFNVLQTHREDVGVSYERAAQFGQFDGRNIDAGPNIVDEAAWQIDQMWKQIKRDIEYSLINGAYVLPGDNNSAAQTRGILAAITTNALDSSDADANGIGVATSADSDDTLDLDAVHGLSVGDDFYFSDLTGGSGVDEDTRYYVIEVVDTDSLKFSATKGGAAVDFGSDITDGVFVPYAEPTIQSVEALMQSAFDNGGLSESEMGLLVVNSGLKRWLTKVFVHDTGTNVRSRNVGGANVQVIETSFGELGIMLNRYVPQGTLAAVSLDQCKAHVREIPGKGVMFAEPLGKDGASDKTQLYTSVGLEYGNEAAHAKDTGFTANSPA